MSDFVNSLFGNNTGTTNIPPFESPGGVTPQQGALADYTAGEGLVGVANEFGSSGTGASTMETQAAGGINAGKAQQLGQMSDINDQALYDLYQNDVRTQLTQLAQQNAQSGSNSSSLGQLVGKNLFGQNQGSFTTDGTTTQ